MLGEAQTGRPFQLSQYSDLVLLILIHGLVMQKQGIVTLALQGTIGLRLVWPHGWRG